MWLHSAYRDPCTPSSFIPHRLLTYNTPDTTHHGLPLLIALYLDLPPQPSPCSMRVIIWNCSELVCRRSISRHGVSTPIMKSVATPLLIFKGFDSQQRFEAFLAMGLYAIRTVPFARLPFCNSNHSHSRNEPFAFRRPFVESVRSRQQMLVQDMYTWYG